MERVFENLTYEKWLNLLDYFTSNNHGIISEEEEDDFMIASSYGDFVEYFIYHGIIGENTTFTDKELVKLYWDDYKKYLELYFGKEKIGDWSITHNGKKHLLVYFTG